MTVQEIFDTPAIKKVENAMIGLEENIERYRVDKPSGLEMMRVLIGLRRNLLADMFVMDENYKRLLSDFNETMSSNLFECVMKLSRLHMV